MTDFTIEDYEALSQLPILANLEEERKTVIIVGELTLAENRRRGYSDWLKVGQAVSELQEEVALHSNSRNPRGRRYSEAWARFATPNLKMLDPAVRSAATWLWRNREAVERWFAILAVNQRDKWTHPSTIKSQF